MSQVIKLLSNRYLLNIIFAIIVARFFWSIMLFFLPILPVQFCQNSSYDLPKVGELSYKFIPEKKVESYSDILGKVIIKAIYKDGKKGFIVVKSGDIQYYINLNGNYRGYTLTKIEKKFVVFEKDRKIYKIIFKGI